MEMETASIHRDEKGDVIIDENGYVTCICEGGLAFQILFENINFNCDSMECLVNDKKVYIQINNDSTYNNENNNAPPKNNPFTWTDASTKLFLCLYKDIEDLLAKRKFKTKKILWKKISENMQEHGYDVSITQVENKFKSLERSYKNMVHHNKQTGRNRAVCSYEMELNDILGQKHSIEPLLLSGNKGSIARSSSAISDSDIAFDTENQSPNISRYTNNQVLNTSPNFIDDIENPGPSTSRFTHQNSENQGSSTLRQVEETNKTPQTERQNMRRGVTAQLMETCKENLEKLTNNIEEHKSRSGIMNSILEEYKEMRKSWETGTDKIHEQMMISNRLREERNELLKDFLRSRRY